jgi:hypothetical protein
MGHCKKKENDSTNTTSVHPQPRFRALDWVVGAFSGNYVISFGLLSVKSDLLWFEHNCYLFDIFRFIHGYFINSSCILLESVGNRLSHSIHGYTRFINFY